MSKFLLALKFLGFHKEYSMKCVMKGGYVLGLTEFKIMS